MTKKPSLKVLPTNREGNSSKKRKIQLTRGIDCWPENVPIKFVIFVFNLKSLYKKKYQNMKKKKYLLRRFPKQEEIGIDKNKFF